MKRKKRIKILKGLHIGKRLIKWSKKREYYIVISHDPALQNPDTLLLQLYYNPNIPENWTNTKTDYGSVSCDISNLATLQNWNDSVTIVVKTGDNSKLLRKISKADFIKPGILYTH